jgi:amino acid permease
MNPNVEKEELQTNQKDKVHQMFDNFTNKELDFSVYDQSEYSFDQKIAKKKSSIIFSIFNTFRSFVAIGILTLPFAVKLVGTFLGLFGLLFIGVIVYLATELLLEIADDSKFKGANYEVLGKLLWGRKGQSFILILLYIISIAPFIGAILFTSFLKSRLFRFCSL